jgi:septal ring factor EnvC (AmiA/AmiB activator)
VSVYERQLDDCWVEISGLKDQLDAATELNGKLAVELAAMRQSRNAADDEATRLTIKLAEQITAKERYARENKILLEKFSGSGIERIVSELSAMRQSRNAADDECTRLSIGLADAKQERDALRREVAALIGEIATDYCPRCAEFAQKCPVKKAEDYGKEACHECWAAWAKQQAAQAGKEVNK